MKYLWKKTKQSLKYLGTEISIFKLYCLFVKWSIKLLERADRVYKKD